MFRMIGGLRSVRGGSWRRRLRWVVVGLCLHTAASRGHASEPTALDLEGAIRLAVAENLTLSLRAAGSMQAKLAVASAEALFALEVKPAISTEVLEHGAQVSVYGLEAARRFRSGATVSALALRQTVAGSLPDRDRWSIEVSQPLLRRFGRLVNEEPIIRSNQALDAAERALAQQEADLVLRVVTTYEEILRLRQQVRADEKAAERVKLLARVTAAKERLGRATRIDTLRVDLQLGQIETGLENGRELLEFARKDLAVLVGADPDARFELAEVPDLDLELPTIEDAVKIALENRLDYAQSLQDLADSSRGVRIARREILPDLSAFASYEEQDTSVGFASNNGAVLFGLRVSSDVFRRDGRIDVSRASVDEQANRQRVKITEQFITRDVQKAWLAYRRSKSQLTVLGSNLEHAEARLELAGRLFRMGRGDNFSVVDAEEAFLRAESDLLDGQSAVTVNGYGLLRSLGTLVEVPKRLTAGRRDS